MKTIINSIIIIPKINLGNILDKIVIIIIAIIIPIIVNI